jgi:Siphovirus ReqiPepy6 Gp37-like protein
LGMKTIRRNTFGTPDGSSSQTNMCVHRGVNRSASVIFSWKSGDMEGAEYLWSNKKLKNSAIVLGRYVNVVVDTVGATKYNRRSMIVSGDDIDGNLGSVPTGGALTSVVSKMQARGREALGSQNNVTITRTDFASVSRYQYRKDFEVGDLIALDGNFGQIAVMRIIEYVEIQDENGESGHPTLALPGV